MTKKTEVKAKAKGSDAEKKVVAKTKSAVVEKKAAPVAKVVKGADAEKKIVKKMQDGNKPAAAKKPVEKKPDAA